MIWSRRLIRTSFIRRSDENAALTMESLEEIKSARRSGRARREDRRSFPIRVPRNQPSLLLDNEHAAAVAQFLRDDPALRLDHCSNVTGVDWLDRKVKKKVKVKKAGRGSGKGSR